MRNCLIRFVAVLVMLSIVLPCAVYASKGSDEEAVDVFSETSAASYLLMDGVTGESLSSRDPDRILPMASTTKIMTCILALENACLSDVVTVPKEAVGVEGSSVYLTKGEKLTMEELLYALMLESANDAAVAIAMHISESISDFADLMNGKAKELNMLGTNYVNPHGLPADGHFSTARDLCKLLAYCIKNESFRVIAGTKKVTICAPNSNKRYLANHNKLLRIYDDCICGKTGFTKEAGRCLVNAAEKNGRVLICATLGDPNDWMDHVSLFKYGFSLLDEKKIVGKNEISVTIPIVGGTKECVMVENEQDFSYWLRQNEKLSCSIESPLFAYADVRQGDALGTAVYSLNGKEVYRLDLFAKEDVPKRNDKLSFWEKIIQKFRLWID